MHFQKTYTWYDSEAVAAIVSRNFSIFIITALNLYEKSLNQNISDPFSEPLESQIHTQINKIEGDKPRKLCMF
jgi:hypothetical protein